MAEINTDVTRHAWLNRKRAAALGVGLGATLVLAPFVWAENPPMASDPAQAEPATPTTMTSSAALIQQQSFAPLVKKVLPAVVNISVSQKGDGEAMSEEQEMTPSPG